MPQLDDRGRIYCENGEIVHPHSLSAYRSIQVKRCGSQENEAFFAPEFLAFSASDIATSLSPPKVAKRGSHIAVFDSRIAERTLTVLHADTLAPLWSADLPGSAKCVVKQLICVDSVTAAVLLENGKLYVAKCPSFKEGAKTTNVCEVEVSGILAMCPHQRSSASLSKADDSSPILVAVQKSKVLLVSASGSVVESVDVSFSSKIGNDTEVLVTANDNVIVVTCGSPDVVVIVVGGAQPLIKKEKLSLESCRLVAFAPHSTLAFVGADKTQQQQIEFVAFLIDNSDIQLLRFPPLSNNSTGIKRIVGNFLGEQSLVLVGEREESCEVPFSFPGTSIVSSLSHAFGARTKQLQQLVCGTLNFEHGVPKQSNFDEILWSPFGTASRNDDDATANCIMPEIVYPVVIQSGSVDDRVLLWKIGGPHAVHSRLAMQRCMRGCVTRLVSLLESSPQAMLLRFHPSIMRSALRKLSSTKLAGLFNKCVATLKLVVTTRRYVDGSLTALCELAVQIVTLHRQVGASLPTEDVDTLYQMLRALRAAGHTAARIGQRMDSTLVACEGSIASAVLDRNKSIHIRYAPSHLMSEPEDIIQRHANKAMFANAVARSTKLLSVAGLSMSWNGVQDGAHEDQSLERYESKFLAQPATV